MVSRVRALGLALAAAASLVAAGCTSAEELPVAPVDEAVEGLTEGPDPARRLTRDEYLQTLKDLLPNSVHPTLDEIAWRIPLDLVSRGFDSMIRTVAQPQVDAWFAVAERLASELAGSPEARSVLSGCLSSPDADTECGAAFVQEFGALAYRRPLTPDEVAQWRVVFDVGLEESVEEAVELVLIGMLQSPNFLYRLELGGDAIDGEDGVYQLTSHEQATRLSYALWGTMPPEELLAAASATPHFEQTELVMWAEDLMDHPRFEERTRRFYEQWFDVPLIPDFRYPPGFVEPHLLENLTDGMKEEVLTYLQRLTLEAQASWPVIMTAPRGLLVNSSQAAIYNLELGDGKNEGWYDFGADSVRAGLLTLPGLLKGANEFPSPVLRGVFVLDKLLCDPIEPPPFNTQPNGAAALPPADASMSNRERWALKTAPGGCQGCHAKIDAFGYALEAFDSVGRHRTEEDTLGVLSGGNGIIVPIDDTATVEVDGQAHPVHGAAELAALLADSDQALRCAALQWFRFSMGRDEMNGDEDVLVPMTNAVRGESMLNAMRSIVRTRTFYERRVHLKEEP